MKHIKTILITLTIMIAFSATAHVGLEKATPAENTELKKSPQQLELVFSSPVRLIKAKLMNAEEQSINFSFTPSADANAQYAWELPTLKEGEYMVEWTILGQDGHKMSGSYQFMLRQSSDNKMKHEMEAKHDQHNHNH